MDRARSSVDSVALRALISAAYDALRSQTIQNLERLLYAVERVERDVSRADDDVI